MLGKTAHNNKKTGRITQHKDHGIRKTATTMRTVTALCVCTAYGFSTCVPSSWMNNGRCLCCAVCDGKAYADITLPFASIFVDRRAIGSVCVR